MHKTLSALTMAVLVACSGCGGGGDTPHDPPIEDDAPTAPTAGPETEPCFTDSCVEERDTDTPEETDQDPGLPPPQEGEGCYHTMRIMLNGDSTMWGFEPGGGGARSEIYPEKALQAIMDQRFGKGIIEVRTGAVSGTTSTDALTQSRDADLIVYNPGINDVAYKHSPTTYWANLRELAKVPGAVFQTPLPVSGQASWAGIMEDVARETGTPLIDAQRYVYSSLPDYFQRHATDGVHPSSTVYEMIARNVMYQVLEPIIAHKLCDNPIYLD
jgi:lysophospholipase L1-like esterase